MVGQTCWLMVDEAPTSDVAKDSSGRIDKVKHLFHEAGECEEGECEEGEMWGNGVVGELSCGQIELRPNYKGY